MSIPESDLASRRPPVGDRPSAASPLYRGRFAPSPTGDLHFGSLIAAVGSYLAARHAGGQWLVRIEDLDPPREIPGSADRILRTLEAFGFEWDGEVVYQSTRHDAYRAAAQHLLQAGLAYECSCSRTEIAGAVAAPANAAEIRYPGSCRHGPLVPERNRALRLVVRDGIVEFTDGLQGAVSCNVGAESGDFVIVRRDGLFAYQLAVTVDDAAQGITNVVRGADLLASTCRQILLQQALALPTPTYQHLPLAVDKSGAKLSKSTGAAALDHRHPGRSLWQALTFLQQIPPPELLPDLNAIGKPTQLWSWAIQQWNPRALRGVQSGVVGLQIPLLGKRQ